MDIFNGPRGEQLRMALIVAGWLLVAFLAVQTVAGLTDLRYIGTGVQAANTISVSGHGEIFATPDIATFSYSVVSDKPTAAAAQTAATTVSNAITDYLKSAGVADADIQTSGYSVYPQYEYQNATCPQPVSPPVPLNAPGVVSSGSGSAVASGGASPGAIVYCPPGKQVLTGYEARQTTTVKVRDLTQAGDLLSGVGTKGATEISSLSFTFDDPNAPQAQARTAAIADAKSKADTLAKELGVTLVRVVSFSENGGGYPQPVMYAASAAGTATKAASPEISPGQNDITDDVSITYEIR